MTLRLTLFFVAPGRHEKIVAVRRVVIEHKQAEATRRTGQETEHLTGPRSGSYLSDVLSLLPQVTGTLPRRNVDLFGR